MHSGTGQAEGKGARTAQKSGKQTGQVPKIEITSPCSPGTLLSNKNMNSASMIFVICGTKYVYSQRTLILVLTFAVRRAVIVHSLTVR